MAESKKLQNQPQLRKRPNHLFEFVVSIVCFFLLDAAIKNSMFRDLEIIKQNIESKEMFLSEVSIPLAMHNTRLWALDKTEISFEDFQSYLRNH
jgi:hypothetical protein